MNKIVRKFSLIIFGVIISLFIVELLLRLSGHLYYQKWMRKEQEAIDTEDSEIARTLTEKDSSREGDKNLCKVVCIGDSFTFGLGASIGHSYPLRHKR